MILQGKHVVLGITGGIAAYKAADLTSKLVQAGAQVDVVMTEAATHFIAPLTFQTLTRRPVSLDMFRLLDETDMTHIALSKRADIVIVAPATANTIAKLACGLADNLLTATVLATLAPTLLAPAMDADMFANPATQSNLSTLEERSFFIVGPEHGRLASGRIGQGRLTPVERIVEAARLVLGRGGPLAGIRVLVTAGGTREPVDPVRYLGNRSSGKMGYSLAVAARDRGAQVRLVSAPTSLPKPYGVGVEAVRTAQEMHREVKAALPQTDILLMAAVANAAMLRNSGLTFKLYAATLPALLIALFSVLGFYTMLVFQPHPFYDARYLIPIAGMLLGNSMSRTIVTLERFYSSLRAHPDEYAAYLTMGATVREASMPFLRSAYMAGIAPNLASYATMGLVALPGMMTGQILGGSSPSVAIKYQIAIILAIFAATELATLLCVWLSQRRSFDDFGFLRQDVLK